jgi:methionyl-tRNA formyltransferase
MKLIFFGTPEFARDTLDTLETHGIIPSLIVAAEDKPVGRKMILTAPPTKKWAEERNIPVLQLKTLRKPESVEAINAYGPFDVGIVASYGKIIPQTILDLPTHGLLNLHPSLLPLHRGASPIQSTILAGDPFGVSIILLDADMDHGPLLAQKEISQHILPKDAYRDAAEKILAQEGAHMISEVLPAWLSGSHPTTEQDHTKATFCKKIEKVDGEVNLATDNPEEIVRKVRAFVGWPGVFFFTDYNGVRIRVSITKAHVDHGLLVVTSVKPEGKKEMSFDDFLRGNRSRT